MMLAAVTVLLACLPHARAAGGTTPVITSVVDNSCGSCQTGPNGGLINCLYTGGTVLTFIGSDLQGNFNVQAPKLCVDALVIVSDTVATCVQKPGMDTVWPAFTGGYFDGSPAAFSVGYDATGVTRPSITQLTTGCGECTPILTGSTAGGVTNCPPTGKSVVDGSALLITFIGTNFQGQLSAPSVCAGATGALTRVSDTVATCPLKSGGITQTSQAMILSSISGPSNCRVLQYGATLLRPKITKIESAACTQNADGKGLSNCPTDGGIAVTFYGENFGVYGARASICDDDQLAVHDTVTPESKFVCVTKNNAIGSVKVTMSVFCNDFCTAASMSLAYLKTSNCLDVSFAETVFLGSVTAPKVLGFYGCFPDGKGNLFYCPSSLDQYILTFTGANFGPSPTADSVCSGISVDITSTSFKCVMKDIAALTRVNGVVTVRVQTDKGETNTRTISFAKAPVITSYTPATGSCTKQNADGTWMGCNIYGGYVVTVVGENFGPVGTNGPLSAVTASVCDAEKPFVQVAPTIETKFTCVAKPQFFGAVLDVVATTTWGSSTPPLKMYFATATCTDNIQNGDESGIDCGGSCGPCGVPTLNAITTASGCTIKDNSVTQCLLNNEVEGVILTFTGSRFGPDGTDATGNLQLSANGATAPLICIPGTYYYYAAAWKFSCSLRFGFVGEKVQVSVINYEGLVTNTLPVTFQSAQCDDYEKNGDETGVDCGGSCEPCNALLPVLDSITVNPMAAGGCQNRVDIHSIFQSGGIKNCPDSSDIPIILTFQGRNFGTYGAHATNLGSNICVAGSVLHRGPNRKTQFTCLLRNRLPSEASVYAVRVTNTAGESKQWIDVAYVTIRPVVTYLSAPPEWCEPDGRGGLQNCALESPVIITFNGWNFGLQGQGVVRAPTVCVDNTYFYPDASIDATLADTIFTCLFKKSYMNNQLVNSQEVYVLMRETISDRPYRVAWAIAPGLTKIETPIINSVVACRQSLDGASLVDCPRQGAPQGDIMLTLTGYGFTTTGSVVEGDVCVADSVTVVSDTRIVCKYKPLTASAAVRVRTQGGLTKDLSISVAGTPIIASITAVGGCTPDANGFQVNCPLTGSVSLTFEGSDLNISGVPSSNICGDSLNVPAGRDANKILTCMMAPGKSGRQVMVTISNGGGTSAPMPFTYVKVATCHNGVKDAGENDKDCGGPSCEPCMEPCAADCNLLNRAQCTVGNGQCGNCKPGLFGSAGPSIKMDCCNADCSSLNRESCATTSTTEVALDAGYCGDCKNGFTPPISYSRLQPYVCSVAVTPAAPNYGAAAVVFHVGESVSLAPAPPTKGVPTSFTIVPAPATFTAVTGLVFNGKTGQITGSPTQMVTATQFTITAANSAGSASTPLSVTVSAVQQSAPSGLFYSSKNPLYVVGVAIVPNYVSYSGGAATAFIISPSTLFNDCGLSFDAVSGTISGTPTKALSAKPYEVTVSNAAGSVAAVVIITVTGTITPTPGNTPTPPSNTVAVVSVTLLTPTALLTDILTFPSIPFTSYARNMLPYFTSNLRDKPVLQVTESGAVASFSVALTAKPTAPVMVQVTSKDTLEGVVSVSALFFTEDNYNQPQTVVVVGVNDQWLDGDQWFAVELVGSSADSRYLTTTYVPVVNVDTFLPAPGQSQGVSAKLVSNADFGVFSSTDFLTSVCQVFNRGLNLPSAMQACLNRLEVVAAAPGFEKVDAAGNIHGTTTVDMKVLPGLPGTVSAAQLMLKYLKTASSSTDATSKQLDASASKLTPLVLCGANFTVCATAVEDSGSSSDNTIVIVVVIIVILGVLALSVVVLFYLRKENPELYEKVTPCLPKKGGAQPATKTTADSAKAGAYAQPGAATIAVSAPAAEPAMLADAHADTFSKVPKTAKTAAPVALPPLPALVDQDRAELAALNNEDVSIEMTGADKKGTSAAMDKDVGQEDEEKDDDSYLDSEFTDSEAEKKDN